MILTEDHLELNAKIMLGKYHINYDEFNTIRFIKPKERLEVGDILLLPIVEHMLLPEPKTALFERVIFSGIENDKLWGGNENNDDRYWDYNVPFKIIGKHVTPQIATGTCTKPEHSTRKALSYKTSYNMKTLKLLLIVIICVSCADKKDEYPPAIAKYLKAQEEKPLFTPSKTHESNNDENKEVEESVTHTTSTASATKFRTTDEVMGYLQNNRFVSKDVNITVTIGYCSEINGMGILIDGECVYYNLSISLVTSTTAVIKGQSLSNPNGSIKLYLDAKTNCLSDNTDTYCRKR